MLGMMVVEIISSEQVDHFGELREVKALHRPKGSSQVARVFLSLAHSSPASSSSLFHWLVLSCFREAMLLFLTLTQ